MADATPATPENGASASPETAAVPQPPAEAQPTSTAPAQPVAAVPAAAPKKYRASINKVPLPPDFVLAVQELEKLLQRPIWLLVQQQGMLEGNVYDGFFAARAQLPSTPVALLVRSPGGQAKAAYQIARLLRRHCSSFTAIVPTYAKSAATLLCLGADMILMGENAELGPLDVQLTDFHREWHGSALDEIQALERLNAEALSVIDQTMRVLILRTKKKVDAVLPLVLNYTATLMRPLLENVDVVQFTQRARLLKVAEEYATRLLEPTYGAELAQAIAMQLVQNYPEHDFFLDADEARSLGLKVPSLSPEQATAIDNLLPYMKLNAFGRIEEA